MFTRGIVLTLAFVVASMVGPTNANLKQAEANDTGKILAGLAVGAVVYGLLDQGSSSAHVQTASRGYYDGNRGSWTTPTPAPSYRAPSRAPSYRAPTYRAPSRAPTYRAPTYRAPSYTPPRTTSRDYRRGYDHGHRDGYNRGYDHGHHTGYDRGYDHGFRDGYDYGTRSPWGCWGY